VSPAPGFRAENHQAFQANELPRSRILTNFGRLRLAMFLSPMYAPAHENPVPAVQAAGDGLKELRGAGNPPPFI
jgi:hypothetical protein